MSRGIPKHNYHPSAFTIQSIFFKLTTSTWLLKWFIEQVGSMSKGNPKHNYHPSAFTIQSIFKELAQTLVIKPTYISSGTII